MFVLTAKMKGRVCELKIPLNHSLHHDNQLQTYGIKCVGS